MSSELCCEELLEDELAVSLVDGELVVELPHAASTLVAAAASMTPVKIRTGLFRINMARPFLGRGIASGPRGRSHASHTQ